MGRALYSSIREGPTCLSDAVKRCQGIKHEGEETIKQTRRSLEAGSGKVEIYLRNISRSGAFIFLMC